MSGSLIMPYSRFLLIKLGTGLGSHAANHSGCHSTKSSYGSAANSAIRARCWPGGVARWLDPGILKKLAARVEKEIIIITGTNGKTTTSNMIAHILQANEHSVVHNRAGANMLNGITHGVYRGLTNLPGSRIWDYALLETDEANVAPLLSEVDAGVLLVTNFFRDQLDRFGELDHTISLITEGVRPQPEVVAQCRRSIDERFCV